MSKAREMEKQLREWRKEHPKTDLALSFVPYVGTALAAQDFAEEPTALGAAGLALSPLMKMVKMLRGANKLGIIEYKGKIPVLKKPTTPEETKRYLAIAKEMRDFPTSDKFRTNLDRTHFWPAEMSSHYSMGFPNDGLENITSHELLGKARPYKWGDADTDEFMGIVEKSKRAPDAHPLTMNYGKVIGESEDVAAAEDLAEALRAMDSSDDAIKAAGYVQTPGIKHFADKMFLEEALEALKSKK